MKLSEITVLSVDEVFTVFSESGRTLDMTNRRTFGLCFCKSGCIEYTKNGKTTVSEQGHAVILPMGESYSLKRTVTGFFPLINFTASERFTSDIMRIRLRKADTYIKDFERMESLMGMGASRAAVMSIMYGMLARLSAESDSMPTVVAKAIRYINENICDSELSNPRIAEHAGVSEVYLRKLFVRVLGTTPKQYVLEMRMQRAKQMLLGNACSVTRIAESCGFSSVYHFCRAFKNMTGQTPTQYYASAELTLG